MPRRWWKAYASPDTHAVLPPEGEGVIVEAHGKPRQLVQVNEAKEWIVLPVGDDVAVD